LRNSPTSVSQLPRKCESLDVSQLYGPQRPVTDIDFIFLFHIFSYSLFSVMQSFNTI
jgi:hypothetical protein